MKPFQFVCLLGALLNTSVMAAPTADEIFHQSTMVEKVADWKADSALEIYVGDRVRVRSGQVFNLLQADGENSSRLFRFNVPADIAGTSFLVHENEPDDDLWMYLPSMAKTRRVLSSNKHDSFMGSDFSYTDLMTQHTGSFTHKLLDSEACGDARCYVIESTPKSEVMRNSIGYGKLISYIREDNYLTHQIRYFDTQGKEFKVQDVSNYQLADKKGNHWIAGLRTMTLLRGKRKSILRFDSIAANSGLDTAMFQQSHMGR